MTIIILKMIMIIPICLPPIKMLGTVFWPRDDYNYCDDDDDHHYYNELPVISNNAFCISSPSLMLSSSIALNVVNLVSSSLAFLQ